MQNNCVTTYHDSVKKWREYLGLGVRFCKPLLDVLGYWKEDLLNIQVCLSTLQHIIFQNNEEWNTFHNRLATCNKSLNCFEELNSILVSKGLTSWGRNNLSWNFHQQLAQVKVIPTTETDYVQNAYPFAFIHVSLISHQNLVDIVRCMLLNITNPIPYVYISTWKQYHTNNKVLFNKMEMHCVQTTKLSNTTWS